MSSVIAQWPLHSHITLFAPRPLVLHAHLARGLRRPWVLRPRQRDGAARAVKDKNDVSREIRITFPTACSPKHGHVHLPCAGMRSAQAMSTTFMILHRSGTRREDAPAAHRGRAARPQQLPGVFTSTAPAAGTEWLWRRQLPDCHHHQRHSTPSGAAPTPSPWSCSLLGSAMHTFPRACIIQPNFVAAGAQVP